VVPLWWRELKKENIIRTNLDEYEHRKHQSIKKRTQSSGWWLLNATWNTHRIREKIRQLEIEINHEITVTLICFFNLPFPSFEIWQYNPTSLIQSLSKFLINYQLFEAILWLPCSIFGLFALNWSSFCQSANLGDQFPKNQIIMILWSQDPGCWRLLTQDMGEIVRFLDKRMKCAEICHLRPNK
jgi:hypothetical protein